MPDDVAGRDMAPRGITAQRLVESGYAVAPAAA